jgi:PAS domain S-box-containing protein
MPIPLAAPHHTGPLPAENTVSPLRSRQAPHAPQLSSSGQPALVLVLILLIGSLAWINLGFVHRGTVGGLFAVTVLLTLIAGSTWLRAVRAERRAQKGRTPEISRAIVEGIARLDSQGTFIEANPGFASIVHMSPQELIGKEWGQVFHAADRETAVRALREAQQQGRAVAVARAVRMECREVQLHISLQTILDRTGLSIGTWCFARNTAEQVPARIQWEEQLERTLAGSGAGLWDWDVRTNEIVLSPRYVGMLGFTTQEFGTHLDAWLTRLHPDDLDMVWKAVQRHLAGESRFDTEFRLRTKSGEYLWVQSRGQAVWDDEGRPVRMSGSMTDITERRSAEERLRESEQRFRLFVQGVQDYAIVMLDSQGRITTWNAGAERIKGYKAEEILGEHISRFYSSEDAAAGVPDRDLQMAASEGQWNAQGWRMRKDGSTLWARDVLTALRDEHGNLCGFAQVTRDLTEQKECEFKLQESVRGYENTARELQFLKFALDEHAIVAITDDRGRITYVNQKFCEISRFSRHELLAQDHRIVNSGHHPKSFFKEMYATIAKGEVWRGEICNRAKDGTLYWVDTTIVPAKDKNGRITNYVAIRADITEKKGAQQTIVRAYEMLAQQNDKLKALSDRAHNFVDDVSHEFRTPLAVIKEFVSIIADGLAGPVSKEQAEYLTILNNAVLDLNHMVEDFLDSSKLRAGRLRVDRQGHEVERIFDGVRPMITGKAVQQRMVLREQIEPGLPRVFADEEKVRRVLMNLAVNAIKFSRGADGIELWARASGDGGVEIGVTDHGPGLAPQDLERLFERFRQFESVPAPGMKGFGLGLNIARQLVWLNLGEMRVQSEQGKGATFSFTLPPDDPAAVVAAYFGRMAECKEPVATMALLEVTPRDSTLPEEVAAFLSATTRPSDLLMRDVHSGASLLLGPTSSAEGWADRIHKARAAATTNTGALQVGVVGSWDGPDRMDRARAATLERVSELSYA